MSSLSQICAPKPLPMVNQDSPDLAQGRVLVAQNDHYFNSDTDALLLSPTGKYPVGAGADQLFAKARELTSSRYASGIQSLLQRGVHRIVMTMGLPGAGKTTSVRDLVTQHPDVLVIDAGNLTQRDRTKWIVPILDKGFQIELFWIKTSVISCLWRNRNESVRGISQRMVLSRAQTFEEPALTDPTFAKVHIRDTDRFGRVLFTLRTMRRLGYPSGQPITNWQPWRAVHNYGVDVPQAVYTAWSNAQTHVNLLDWSLARKMISPEVKSLYYPRYVTLPRVLQKKSQRPLRLKAKL